MLTTPRQSIPGCLHDMATVSFGPGQECSTDFRNRGSACPRLHKTGPILPRVSSGRDERLASQPGSRFVQYPA
jgi:hypothetical protein